MDYATARSTANALNETNDCAVIATAIAANVPYEVSHKLFALRGRKSRQGTALGTIIDVVNELGCTRTDVTKQYPSLTTVNRLNGRLPKSGRFMVLVSRHILAVTDGVVQDWTQGRQHRVKAIWEITRNDAPVTPVEPAPATRIVIAPTKAGSVKEKIHAVANRMWSDAGKPMDVVLVRKLRIMMMNELEVQGVKRTTASVELGNWQKLTIK